MGTSADVQMPLGNGSGSAIIDRAIIMERVGGDEELLREITAIFLEEYPSLMNEIKAAVATRDAKRLEESAHALKGSVANFGATAATQAAYRLETLGRHGDMQNADRAFEDLLVEFQHLHPALEALTV